MFTSVDAIFTNSTHDSLVLHKSGLVEMIAPYRGNASIYSDFPFRQLPLCQVKKCPDANILFTFCPCITDTLQISTMILSKKLCFYAMF